MKANAVVKAIGSQGRVVVPSEMIRFFNKSADIKVVRYGENSIMLTQTMPKNKKDLDYFNKCTVSSIKPFSNGTVQLCVSQYFKETADSVVCFNNNNTVIINALD